MWIFGPLVAARTSAVTVTEPRAAAVERTDSPSTTISGCRLRLVPTAPSTLSISRTSPTATLCWRPPLRTTAYTPDLLSSMSSGSLGQRVHALTRRPDGHAEGVRHRQTIRRVRTEVQGYAGAPAGSNHGVARGSPGSRAHYCVTRAPPDRCDGLPDAVARGWVAARADGGRRPRHLRGEVHRCRAGPKGAGRRDRRRRAGPGAGHPHTGAGPDRGGRRDRPTGAGRGGAGARHRERRAEPGGRLPARIRRL